MILLPCALTHSDVIEVPKGGQESSPREQPRTLFQDGWPLYIEIMYTSLLYVHSAEDKESYAEPHTQESTTPRPSFAFR